jgi:hypothetical protein
VPHERVALLVDLLQEDLMVVLSPLPLMVSRLATLRQVRLEDPE